jgi:hypothetical protein
MMGESMCSIGFTARFPSRDSTCSLVIDDDGRVGYAYLLDAEGRISGDVWLYNRCPAPIEPEWSDRDKAPFANPEPYVNLRGMTSLPTSAEDFSVEWRDQGNTCAAMVFICGKLAAKLIGGAKPGWSALARKDGPLAQVLFLK